MNVKCGTCNADVVDHPSMEELCHRNVTIAEMNVKLGNKNVQLQRMLVEATKALFKYSKIDITPPLPEFLSTPAIMALEEIQRMEKELYL